MYQPINTNDEALNLTERAGCIWQSACLAISKRLFNDPTASIIVTENMKAGPICLSKANDRGQSLLAIVAETVSRRGVWHRGAAACVPAQA